MSFIYNMIAQHLFFISYDRLGIMAPRALASSTIAAFAQCEDVFIWLVTDVLDRQRVSKGTADAVNMVLLRHLGIYTTMKHRRKFKRIWLDLEVGLDAPNLHSHGMQSLSKVAFSKLHIKNNF